MDGAVGGMVGGRDSGFEHACANAACHSQQLGSMRCVALHGQEALHSSMSGAHGMHARRWDPPQKLEAMNRMAWKMAAPLYEP